MTRALPLLAFLFTFQAEGQRLDTGRADSLLQRIDHQGKTLLDSINSIASINRYRDSLRILVWSDSLRQRVNLRYDSRAIASIVDSLRRIRIPHLSITHSTDSLVRVRETFLKEVSEKQRTLQESVLGRYTRWSESIRSRFNLDSAGARPPGLPSGANAVTLPDPALAGGTQAPGTSVDLPQIPSLQTEDFSGLGVSPELKAVGGDLALPNAQQLSALDSYLPEMPDPMKEINGQIAGAKAFKDNPGDAVEKTATNIAEVKQATSALKEAEAMKQQSEALNVAGELNSGEDGAALRKEAMNHLAGQEKVLQSAMSQMAKYKKKYSSIGILSEIPKNNWLPRNGLKGQPFQKRFRVGLNSGFKPQGDTLHMDLYPNASYRITGRIEAGLGANYRLCIDSDPLALKQQNATWGLHVFTMVKTFKSVFIRVELDGNNLFKSETADHPAYRDWRWAFHTGVQTNFKLGKRWTGNVQMLYNFDSSLKDGFPEKLSPRIGVQYSLK